MFGDKRFRGYLEDIPLEVGSRYSKVDISERLPAGLYGRYELKSFEPVEMSKDPVVLRNRWHQIIYQWSDGFVPSWIDVLNVCNQLGLT